jgi:putative acetyltransferase
MEVAENIQIKTGDLENEQVLRLVDHHLRDVRQGVPVDSVHALGVEKLKAADVTFYTLWFGDTLAGCGALKEINRFHGEVKSMRTQDSFLRKGVARKMLEHIIAEARKRGYGKLSLETGAGDPFFPAHGLYRTSGFGQCGPFEGYREDPNSIFMTMEL